MSHCGHAALLRKRGHSPPCWPSTSWQLSHTVNFQTCRFPDNVSIYDKPMVVQILGEIPHWLTSDLVRLVFHWNVKKIGSSNFTKYLHVYLIVLLNYLTQNFWTIHLTYVSVNIFLDNVLTVLFLLNRSITWDCQRRVAVWKALEM